MAIFNFLILKIFSDKTLIKLFIKAFLLITIFSSYSLSQNGFVYTYYSTGEIEGVLFYAKNVLEGTSYWYHPNGNLKAEKTYSNGKLNGLVKEFYDSGLMKSEIAVKEGVRDGISKFYYENGSLSKIESYENGILIKEVELDYDPLYVAPLEDYKYANTQERIKKNEDLFLCEGADVCPKPVGGMDEIIKHLVFPEHAKLYGLEGFVTVVADVDSLGKVKSVNVLKDLGLGTKESAITAVNNSRFLPGEKEGKQVASKVLFKIPFFLNNKIKYATALPSKDKKIEQRKKKSIKITSTQKTNKDKTIPTEKKQVNNTITKKPIVIQNFSCNCDVCAKPKEGIKAILDNFIMPSVVKRKGLEGEVVVEAVVDSYGNVRDTKVVKELGYGCDIAVEVAILQTKFSPGISNGKPHRCTVRIIVPIIQKKNEEAKQ